MLRLPTVLLKHTTRAGSHHDWMLCDPRDPRGLLWTVRISQPSAQWPALRRWRLERIAPHRRIYLSYQGPISQGRGSVLRVDRGWFTSQIWTDHRIVIDLQFNHCQGLVELQRTSGTLWTAMMQSPAALTSGDSDETP